MARCPLLSLRAHVFSTVISTRRFSCRPCVLSLPSGFVFGVTGFVSLKARVVMIHLGNAFLFYQPVLHRLRAPL